MVPDPAVLERLAALPPLSRGSHAGPGEGACVMEAVALDALRTGVCEPATEQAAARALAELRQVMGGRA